jgi:hypothetical protein
MIFHDIYVVSKLHRGVILLRNYKMGVIANDVGVYLFMNFFLSNIVLQQNWIQLLN